ncbi:MAG: hypothetical protein V4598_05715 [Bdellovibrionota bacterium]
MKLTITILSFLLVITSCGKKGGGGSSISETQYVQDPEALLSSLKDDFDQKQLSDGFNSNTEVTYLYLEVKPGVDTFRSLPMTKTEDTLSCTQLNITTTPSFNVSESTQYGCGSSSSVSGYYSYYSYGSISISNQGSTVPSQSSYSSSTIYDLDAALTSTEYKGIALRKITYGGKTYSGYGIQVKTGLSISSDYKEYVIVPAFPKVLNPVLTFESDTGYVSAMEGIKVL